MATRQRLFLLQEGRVDDDPLACCTCGGEIFRGFDPLIADHIRLVWICHSCGRIWQVAAAVVIAGTLRPISAAESEAWR